MKYKDDAQFCPECGGKLEVMAEKRYCQNCGFELQSFMLFCPECGFGTSDRSIDSSVEDKPRDDIGQRETSIQNENVSKGIISYGQVVYLLICMVMLYISYSGTNQHLSLLTKCFCAIVSGVAIEYLLIVINYVWRQMLFGRKLKAFLGVMLGFVGLVIVSIGHWTVLSTYKLSSGIPYYASRVDGLAIMVGSTIGAIAVCMIEGAIIFFVGRTIYRKIQG